MADIFQLTASSDVPRQWLGDRAYHLSQLAAQQAPILPGVVVSGRLLRNIWEETPWREPLLAELSHSTLHLNPKDARQLQGLAQHIRQALVEVELATEHLETLVEETQQLNAQSLIFHPSLYIDDPENSQRSSRLSSELVALFDSHGSGGDHDNGTRHKPDQLSQTLKQSWAELFRARSLFYWQRAGISLDQIYLAILIQPLEPTLVSGHLHVRSPLMEVTATRGLPQPLSQGWTHPERCRLEIDSGAIRQQDCASSFCYHQLNPSSSAIELVAINSEEHPGSILDPELLQRLHQQGQRLYTHLKEQADLEWVLTSPSPEVEPTWFISQYYPQGCSNLRWPDVSPPLGDRSTLPTTRRQGIGASTGQIQGIVCLLKDAVKLTHTQEQRTNPSPQILVVPDFEPQQSPPCHQIAGLITEQGSRTSHGAIWARELGIPAVMGVAGITAEVISGQGIYLDGESRSG